EHYAMIRGEHGFNLLAQAPNTGSECRLSQIERRGQIGCPVEGHVEIALLGTPVVLEQFADQPVARPVYRIAPLEADAASGLVDSELTRRRRKCIDKGCHLGAQIGSDCFHLIAGKAQAQERPGSDLSLYQVV